MAANNENKEELSGEEKKEAGKPTMWIIALAGPSSAGKTVCAIVLQEILAFLVALSLQPGSASQNRSSHESNITLVPITNTELGSEGQGKKGVALIHQDAYFYPKSFCPVTSFFSVPADLKFILQSSMTDGVMRGCEYVLKWTRNHKSSSASGSYSIKDGTSTGAMAGKVSDEFDKWSTRTTTGSGSTESATQDGTPIWEVIGPDADCWSAINIASLITNIKDTKATGILSPAATSRQELCSLLTAEERSAILKEYAKFISEMRAVVAGRVVLSKKEETEQRKIRRGTCLYVREGLDIQGVIEAQAPPLPPICIVDGFLLLADPSPDAEDAPIDVRNLKAKHELMGLFDLKLFLPVSEEEAKRRRFNRLQYIDPVRGPNGEVNEDGQVGGQRKLGQMWKTEGYFKDVAWANYVHEAAWLFKDGDVESFKESDACLGNGVKMRPASVNGVEDTVRWAIKTILDELETRGHGVKPVQVEEEGIEVRQAGAFVDSVIEVEVEMGMGVQELEQESKSFKTLIGMKITKYRDNARERIRTLKDRASRWIDGLTKGDLAYVLSLKFRTGTKRARKQNANGVSEGRDIGQMTVLGSGEVEQRLHS